MSNVLAAGTLAVSLSVMARFYVGARGAALTQALAQPSFAASAMAAAASVLYLLAFGGVAFIHADVTAASAEAAAVAAAARPVPPPRDMDADVVVVGAGTAGATLAATLARQGKRVTLIER